MKDILQENTYYFFTFISLTHFLRRKCVKKYKKRNISKNVRFDFFENWPKYTCICDKHCVKMACLIYFQFRRYSVLKLPDRTNFCCVRTAYTSTTALYLLHTHRCNNCVYSKQRTRVQCITTVCIIHQLVLSNNVIYKRDKHFLTAQ